MWLKTRNAPWAIELSYVLKLMKFDGIVATQLCKSLSLYRVEVTTHSNASKNTFEVKEIQFKVYLDSLFGKKW